MNFLGLLNKANEMMQYCNIFQKFNLDSPETIKKENHIRKSMKLNPPLVANAAKSCFSTKIITPRLSPGFLQLPNMLLDPSNYMM